MHMATGGALAFVQGWRFLSRPKNPCIHVVELSGGVGDRPNVRDDLLDSSSSAEASALALLVTRVVANHHHATVPADDLALVADLLDARLNLHSSNLFNQR